MVELYTYWRADAADASAVRDAVMALQSALRADWSGLEARLLVRPELDGAGRHTWMEIYRRPSPGLDTATIEAIEARAAAATARWIRGARHRELFVAAS
jgi:hypothetical protein